MFIWYVVKGWIRFGDFFKFSRIFYFLRFERIYLVFVLWVIEGFLSFVFFEGVEFGSCFGVSGYFRIIFYYGG